MGRKKKPNATRRSKEYARQRWQARKELALERLEGKCAGCGSSEDLQFDHIDPSTKEHKISSIYTYSMERFLAEVDKCQLLCRECHEKKSIKDAGKESSKGLHGSRSAARHCGPPMCDACREASRKYQKIKWMRRLQREGLVEVTPAGEAFMEGDRDMCDGRKGRKGYPAAHARTRTHLRGCWHAGEST